MAGVSYNQSGSCCCFVGLSASCRSVLKAIYGVGGNRSRPFFVGKLVDGSIYSVRAEYSCLDPLEIFLRSVLFCMPVMPVTPVCVSSCQFWGQSTHVSVYIPDVPAGPHRNTYIFSSHDARLKTRGCRTPVVVGNMRLAGRGAVGGHAFSTCLFFVYLFFEHCCRQCRLY